MNRLTIYKATSYLLLPVGAVLGLVTLFGLFLALGNFTMLISVFLTGACVIYIYSSFVFLRKGIERREPMKRSFKDLIKVNAYVALFFSIIGLLQGILILMNPEAIKLLLENMKTMQPGSPQAADPAMLQKGTKMTLYFIIVISAMLLFHVTSTLRFIKQKQDLFSRQ